MHLISRRLLWLFGRLCPRHSTDIGGLGRPLPFPNNHICAALSVGPIEGHHQEGLMSLIGGHYPLNRYVNARLVQPAVHQGHVKCARHLGGLVIGDECSKCGCSRVSPGRPCMYASLSACGISTSQANAYLIHFGCGCAMSGLSPAITPRLTCCQAAPAASSAPGSDASNSFGDGNDITR